MCVTVKLLTLTITMNPKRRQVNVTRKSNRGVGGGSLIGHLAAGLRLGTALTLLILKAVDARPDFHEDYLDIAKL